MMLRSILLLAMIAAPRSAAADEIRFNRDVRPILSEHCWQCHGPDEANRQGELRLDDRDQAILDHGNGATIVPGEAANSLLMQRVTSDDDGERMPPVDHGPPLASKEIETLRRWIDEGAHFEGHWAFLPITNPAPPAIESGESAHNPIDHFVLKRLHESGLRASPEADKRTLLRRVYLDLIGLPPTPEEADAFERDTRPEAYEEVVERLLQSPHYGERWGRHWLDQARYADSNGYTIDAVRVMWPYRDWVIRALNADMPFDQFTIEQLAGDLLPDATREQRIATGFHRNTLINQEGGVDDEQFRIETVMDRVATTGAVWLGLTIGCAQCHTHKYDPISHREYYQFFAFFNNCEDMNNVGPTVDVHEGELFLPEESTPLHDALNNGLAHVEHLIAQRPARRAAWEQELAAKLQATASTPPPQWNTVPIRSATAEAATFTVLEDQSVLATPGIPRETYLIDAAQLVPGTKVGSLRLRFIPHESLPKQGPGLATNGNLVLSAVEVYLGEERLALVAASADHAQKDYPVDSLIDDDSGTGWSINVEPGSIAQMNAEHVVILTLGSQVDVGDRPLRFVLKHELNNDFNVGRVQFSVAEEVVDPLTDPVFVAALMVEDAQRSGEQRKLIEGKFDAGDQDLKAARAQLESVRVQLDLGPTVKTMVLREASPPRNTFLLKRGDFLQPDKDAGPLTAGVPQTFPPPTPRADGGAFDRFDLAHWLVAKCRAGRCATSAI